MTATLSWRPLRTRGERGSEPPWQSETFADEGAILDTLTASLPTGDWLYRADLDPVHLRRTVKLGGGNRTLAEPAFERSAERVFVVVPQAAWVLMEGHLVGVPECVPWARNRFPRYSPASPGERGFDGPSERARYEMRQTGMLRDVPSWPPYKDLPPVDWFHAYTMPAADSDRVWLMARSAFDRDTEEWFRVEYALTRRFIALQARRCPDNVVRDALACIDLAADVVRGAASKSDLERTRARMERHGEGKGRDYDANKHHGVVYAAAQCAAHVLGTRPWGWVSVMARHMPRGDVPGLMPLPEGPEESVTLCEWIREAAPFDDMARAMILRGEWT